MVPNPWAWGSHTQLALQLHDHLRAKASAGAGRAKASLMQCLGNRSGGPAGFSQRLSLVADLRIGTQLAQLAHRPDHNTLGVTATDPLDTHIYTLTAALHVHDDPFNAPFE